MLRVCVTNSDMLNKIFLGLLAAAALAMSVLTYLQYSWLQSITKPADVAANYHFYDNIYSSVLWISSLILVIFGSVILWKQRKSWAMWISLAYFAVFVIIQTWWLGEMFFRYKKQNGLWQGEFSLGGLFGVLLCVVGVIIVFFAQFILLRMRDRIHGSPNSAIGTNGQNDFVVPDTEKSETDH